MDVASHLAAVSAPVAVIAAAADTVVPPERIEAVRRAAKRLVLDRVIPGAGHNDLFHGAPFRQAMQNALSRSAAVGRPGG